MSRSCPRTGNICQMCDTHCWIKEFEMTPLSFYTPPRIPSVVIPVNEVRVMYAGLGRAIESGDPLQIGLILGQVYKELEKYVNTSATGDNRAPISFNQEGKGIQPVSHGGSGSASGDKEGDIPTSSNEA